MRSRESTLIHLTGDMRFASFTTIQALTNMSPSMSWALDEEDQRFFKRHADDPCHEVARACRAGHVWHGDENK